MRSALQAQTETIEGQVQAGLDLAIATLDDLATCLAGGTRQGVASIASSADAMRINHREVNTSIVATIARQAPVACDLRLLLVLMEVAHHTDLIANQFKLIGAHFGEGDRCSPDELGTLGDLARMAKLANAGLADAAASLRRRDAELARRVGARDAAINTLNREVFARTLRGSGGRQAREVAMRHVLVARSLERIGDNAVDIAEQTVCLVTGELCEFSDASHPLRVDAA